MQIDRQRVLHLMTTHEVGAVTLENLRPIRAEPTPAMPPLVRQPLVYVLFFGAVMFALPRVPGLYGLLICAGVTEGDEVPAADPASPRLDTSRFSGLVRQGPVRPDRSSWLEPT